MARIVQGLRQRHPDVPVIAFPRGAGTMLQNYVEATGVNGVSLDPTITADWACHALGKSTVLQGNLDPALLDQRPQAVISAARNLLTRMSPHPGHVFNLGHGIRPTAKIECVEALVETVTKHSNQN